MTDLRLTSTEIELLTSLLSHDAISVIWDVNAFYFNTQNVTYKLECFDTHPEGSDYEYDEVFFCRFEKLGEYVELDDSQSGYWFKTIIANAKIRSIEIIETAHIFPEDILTDAPASGAGVTLVSLGLVIRTDTGNIPAFLLPSNYGFAWLTEQRFYSLDEVEALLQYDIKLYNAKSLLP